MENFKYVDLSRLEDAFSVDNDLPYPEWKRISGYIRSHFPETQWRDAWGEVVSQWLEKLAAALGSGYVVDQSSNYFTMSCRDSEGRRKLIDVAEQLRGRMIIALKGIELRKTYGKRVILLFGDLDAYYRYVSHFFPDGSHILSAGTFLRSGGYAHIAMPDTGFQIARTLSHELAHNCLMTLPLPLWLNEGMAGLLEAEGSASRDYGLDADLAQRHFSFWDSGNIQDFWFGPAFGNPDTSELAYSLANILIGLITQENLDLKQFVQHANYSDAGAKAAEEYLGRKLGEVAGIFLGPGDWAPKPPPPDVPEKSAKN